MQIYGIHNTHMATGHPAHHPDADEVVSCDVRVNSRAQVSPTSANFRITDEGQEERRRGGGSDFTAGVVAS